MESTQEQKEPQTYRDLGPDVRAARRGFRRDVTQLVQALPHGALLVPLATALDNIPLGEDVTPEDGEVRLVPHLLPEAERGLFVPLFTDPDVLKTVGHYLQWSTDGDSELQYCTLPAQVALDLALQLIDGDRIHGAVINPSDEYELILSRNEVGALAQGKAVPLVGYVQEIPFGKDEAFLVSELDLKPSPELLEAIRTCLEGLTGVQGFDLKQTFNAERDLEPHPTLTLKVADETAIDMDELNRRLAKYIEGKLPEPGYLDVLFDSDLQLCEGNE